MKKKVYKITVNGPARLAQLLYELAQWGEDDFDVVDNGIITSNKNAIDIAAETFRPLHIEEQQEQ